MLLGWLAKQSEIHEVPIERRIATNDCSDPIDADEIARRQFAFIIDQAGSPKSVAQSIFSGGAKIGLSCSQTP